MPVIMTVKLETGHFNKSDFSTLEVFINKTVKEI